MHVMDNAQRPMSTLQVVESDLLGLPEAGALFPSPPSLTHGQPSEVKHWSVSPFGHRSLMSHSK